MATCGKSGVGGSTENVTGGSERDEGDCSGGVGAAVRKLGVNTLPYGDMGKAAALLQCGRAQYEPTGGIVCRIGVPGGSIMFGGSPTPCICG